MSATLKPGSYSHGTLRDEDMRDMFVTIENITRCEWCDGEIQNLDDLLADSNERGLFVGADISESIAYLFDHVEEHHVPEGHYFGSLEGDGSDFGVWAIGHDFQQSRFTGTTTCSRCGLLPMDDDDMETPCRVKVSS